jgi:hypothetical protein
MDKKLKIKKADPGISPIGLVGGPPFPKVHKATVVNRRRRKMKLGGTVSLKIRIAARSPKSSVTSCSCAKLRMVRVSAAVMGFVSKL